MNATTLIKEWNKVREYNDDFELQLIEKRALGYAEGLRNTAEKIDVSFSMLNCKECNKNRKWIRKFNVFIYSELKLLKEAKLI